MQVLVVIGHQNTKKNSFCHAIAQTVIQALQVAGHTYVFHDLYDEQFDPILPHDEILVGASRAPIVRTHCEEVVAADAFVVVHPNWWGQPPAILKGWIDRVFCQGVVYEFGDGGTILGHLKGKKALVFTTSNTPREMERQRFGDPLENLWKTCIFGFCGVTDFYRRNFESIVMSTPEQRAEWLAEVSRTVKERFSSSTDS